MFHTLSGRWSAVERKKTEGADNFKTLVAAVKAAGLVETLQGKGPFTVFAPTDAAFAKLPAGTVEDLLKPENRDKLVAILMVSRHLRQSGGGGCQAKQFGLALIRVVGYSSRIEKLELPIWPTGMEKRALGGQTLRASHSGTIPHGCAKGARLETAHGEQSKSK